MKYLNYLREYIIKNRAFVNIALFFIVLIIVLFKIWSQNLKNEYTVDSPDIDTISVSVIGGTHNTGKYVLHRNSTMAELIVKAGGLLPEINTCNVNLLYVLRDNEVIDINSADTGKINVNSATLEQLMEIPGIGRKYAQNIIDYRENKKKYFVYEELLNVKGIGRKRLEKMKSYIVIQ